MTDHSVIIAGGGPTGLTLAGGLALQGVDVAIVERRTGQGLTGRRAGGLHSRTIEIFDQRGIAERFIAEGQKAQATGFAGVRFDISGLPTRHPYTLGIWQTHTERILTEWAEGLGAKIHRGVEVTGFDQDGSGVTVTLSDGRSLHAAYLVGCDGGRSVVRKAAGIDFVGSDPTTSNIIGEVEMTEIPEFGVHRTPLGLHSFGRSEYKIVDGKIIYADHGPIGVMVTERAPGATTDPTLADLREALIAATGKDYGIHSPTWISRFTDATRQAATYRKGRVLVAGDAAHIHPPDGGHGLQLGVHDAVNLGWKLAQVVKGTSPESLLDTYHSERHPAAARVLRHTMASVVMRRDDDRSKALRETIAELVSMEEPRRKFAADMSELAVHYDLGTGHPLLGRRMPDLDLETANGPLRGYTLLHKGRPVVINLGVPNAIDITPWSDRVQLINAKYSGIWDLPDVGIVAPPTAVLVRPDGHVAWLGDGSNTGLSEALTTWFGPPVA